MTPTHRFLPLVATLWTASTTLAGCVDGPATTTVLAEIELPARLMAEVDTPVALVVAWAGETEVFDVLCTPPEQDLTWSWEGSRAQVESVHPQVVTARIVTWDEACGDEPPAPSRRVLAQASATVFEDVRSPTFVGYRELDVVDEVRLTLGPPDHT